MQQYWKSLAVREQWMALGCSLFVLFAVLAFGVVKPLYSHLDSQQNRYQAALKDQQWLASAAEQIKSQRKGGSKTSTGSISSIVDGTLPKYKLKMQRYQPSGRNKAQLWFEEVPFNQLLEWMNHLETEQGLRIDAVSINNEQRKGFVSARIRLQR
ncbi:general secretion pathway protein M [Sinobacterium caligoides]|uniref:General secretion pathway protein M n=1 Tax=Sinobacterium caligoides TaxID=933926 RepID=A0A3N2DNF7_9GAMM|nr:type II secretion system protein M [Sinobacterium caligoides]ROS01341.1 general secretion pathway protein M [Sinobacterium caligoides]